jgi:hypothetical protein
MELKSCYVKTNRGKREPAGAFGESDALSDVAKNI